MSTLPEIPFVVPNEWNTIEPRAFKIALATVDDLGFPFDRKGTTVNTPDRLEDHRKFAKAVGEMVERTILQSLGVELDGKS